MGSERVIREQLKAIIHLARAGTDMNGGPRPTLDELADYCMTGDVARQARAMKALEDGEVSIAPRWQDSGYIVYGPTTEKAATLADLTNTILEERDG